MLRFRRKQSTGATKSKSTTKTALRIRKRRLAPRKRGGRALRRHSCIRYTGRSTGRRLAGKISHSRCLLLRFMRGTESKLITIPGSTMCGRLGSDWGVGAQLELELELGVCFI